MFFFNYFRDNNNASNFENSKSKSYVKFKRTSNLVSGYRLILKYLWFFIFVLLSLSKLICIFLSKIHHSTGNHKWEISHFMWCWQSKSRCFKLRVRDINLSHRVGSHQQKFLIMHVQLLQNLKNLKSEEFLVPRILEKTY